MNASALDIQASGVTTTRFTQSGQEGLELKVADLATVLEPVRLKLDLPSSLKLRVLAGRSTRLQLIIDETAPGSAAGESSLDAEFTLAPGACVKLLHLRRGGAKARRSAHYRYRLDSHADLEVFGFNHEGELSSSEHVVEFQAEHGFASFKGLSILHGSSVTQDRVIADHIQGHCTSRQFYKNILADQARSEFHSLVAVKKGAVKSDSRQLNKNLLLSDNARAEARPELRIDADDVACAHGAAVGRIDKDELFYLRSRGLSEPLARYILTLGFAEELIGDIEPEPLRAELRELAKAQIKASLGFKEGK